MTTGRRSTVSSPSRPLALNYPQSHELGKFTRANNNNNSYSSAYLTILCPTQRSILFPCLLDPLLQHNSEHRTQQNATTGRQMATLLQDDPHHTKHQQNTKTASQRHSRLDTIANRLAASPSATDCRVNMYVTTSM